MRRTGDIGGGTKVLVWVGSFTLAIGAFWGIRKWRDHAAASEARSSRTAALARQLEDLTHCLVSYDRVDGDLRTAITFRVAEGIVDRAGCERTAGDIQYTLREAARELHQDVPELGTFTLDGPGDESISGVCRWLQGARDAITKLGGTVSSVPTCEPANRLALVAAPDQLPATARLDGELTSHDGLTLAYPVENDTVWFARTSDGTTWDARQSQVGASPLYYAWTDDGLYTLTWHDQLLQLFAADGTIWAQRAKLRIPYIDAVMATQGGAIVIGADLDTTQRNAVRSTDGGRTFGAPVRLLKEEQKTGHWDLATHANRDGSLAIAAMPEEGPARLETYRLEPGAKAMTKLRELTWPEPGDGRKILSCADGDTIWMLVRQHHVVVSHDAGRSWFALPGIDETLRAPRLSCTRERLGIVDPDVVYTCEGGCQGAVMPPGMHPFGVMRVAGATELWVGAERSDLDFHDSKPMTLLVYRFDNVLVRDRVHVLDTKGRLRAVAHDGKIDVLERL